MLYNCNSIIVYAIMLPIQALRERAIVNFEPRFKKIYYIEPLYRNIYLLQVQHR